MRARAGVRVRGLLTALGYSAVDSTRMVTALSTAARALLNQAHDPHLVAMVDAAVGEAAHYWSPEPDVRFVADVAVVDRWSEAK